jgi:tetratricopeptide (TPR) repeat protein
MCTVSAAFLACMPAYAQPRAQDTGPALNEQQLEREFQAASTEYGSGHFTEAAARLEKLLLAAPRVFEVHELLALTYSAESLDSKAKGHFEAAVRLRPGSAAARINLAANLGRLNKPAEAEQQFKEALKLEPGNFEANHDLGEFYIQTGRISDAAPFLERAQKIDASSYDNGFDLALADLQMQKLPEAGQLVQDLLKKKETAELHNLLAQIEEKSGSFVDAANEYEMAAHMDASESNLFDWGSELLLHRTLEPAIEVFRRATELFPNSPRLAIGYGIALYSRGNYDDAVTALIRAADLSPADARCYMFLSRAYDSSLIHADEVIERFRRFSQLQPQNGRAFYYYAISLWKGKRTQDTNVDLAQIESLLKKALTLDPSLAEAHLQLGNLYSDQSKYTESIPEYQQALDRNPDLADAHYRLGQALVRTGDKSRAQEQFQVYQQLRAQQTADLDKQRAEIRQFVYSEQNVGAEKQ